MDPIYPVDPNNKDNVVNQPVNQSQLPFTNQPVTVFSSPTVVSSTGPIKNKGKTRLIIGLIIAVVLLLGAGSYWFWQSRNHDDQSADKNKSAQTATAAGPLAKIQAKYADFQIKPDKFVASSSTSTGHDYPLEFFIYDSKGTYIVVSPEAWQYYQLGASPQTSDSVCDNALFKTKYGDTVSFVRSAFEDAGYTVAFTGSANKNFYTQYNNCQYQGSGFTVSNSTQNCSVWLRQEVDVTQSVSPSNVAQAALSVACSSQSSLKPKLDQVNKANNILQSVGFSSKFNFLNSIKYIKDSVTANYKIAKMTYITGPDSEDYFYQKGDSAWVLVSEDGSPLDCATTDANVRAAFKGEKCSTLNKTIWSETGTF